MILFSELFICGCSHKDMILKFSFVRLCKKEIESLTKDTKEDGSPSIVIGSPIIRKNNIYNAILVLD